MITAAATRIESIANDLISKFTGASTEDARAISFVASVAESIIAETRVLLSNQSGIEIKAMIPSELTTATVPISSANLARVLSNLVNNSMEALRGRSDGLIHIALSSREDRITLSITDNGRGIPADILYRLKTVGGSYGKANGAGMGLQNAKATLAKIGGSLSLESEFGEGTTVAIELPLVSFPKWCAETIDLSDASTIVVLDDDPGMHLLWQKRLGTDGVVYLSDPEQFDLAQYPPVSTRYILDYEICGSPVTGLDLITSHQLGRRVAPARLFSTVKLLGLITYKIFAMRNFNKFI